MPSSSQPQSRPLRVAVVGGGLGGLCLAQGLKRAGAPLDVAVFERDRTRTDRLQGYRVHIDPAGSRALHACLPPALYAAFVATCGVGGNGFSMLTEGLREVFSFEADDPGAMPDPVESHKSASRITLRQVLLSGLEANVHFAKTFARFELEPDDTVVLRFEDGSAATADVLVGADGGNSRVRRQLLPHAQRVETGILGVAAKVPLTPETRAMVPDQIFRGPALIGARQGRAMFVAVQAFKRRAERGAAIGGDDAAAALHPGILFDNTGDYLMWAFSARRETYGAIADAVEDPEHADGAAWQRAVLGLTGGWHPALRRLVAMADPSTVAPLPIRTSVPPEPWPASRVTLLGDAIHSMTPYRGVGANVALRDAALLCRRLTAAARGELPLLEAIAAYEAEMRGYGFAAVRGSLQAMRQAHAENPVARTLARTAFRTVNAIPPLKRRATARFADA